MQPLLDGPRAGLSEAFVKSLLQSHSTIRISYGAKALAADFTEVADISQYITSGSEVSSSVDNTVHRTCTLHIDADVTTTGWSYLSGFVKPYMTIEDVATGQSATFHLGVYTLTTPSRGLGTTPATLQFTGYDLNYLLRQPIGDSYEAAAGTDPAQAAGDVISLAIPNVAVTVVASGSVLPSQITWPFDASKPTTYLDIITGLLASVGYRQPWADWDGTIRVEPFVDLQTAKVEWTFDIEDPANIVADDRTQDIDLYNVPNWWRFVMADLPDTPVEGQTQFTWEDNSAVNPGSTLNRGRRIRHIESVKAASYDDLVSYAQRVIVDTIKPGETFTVKTQPFPLAWHLDVIRFNDPALEASLPSTAGGRRVVATSWKLALDGQTDMEWTWQTISDQTAGLGITTSTIAQLV